MVPIVIHLRSLLPDQPATELTLPGIRNPGHSRRTIMTDNHNTIRLRFVTFLLLAPLLLTACSDSVDADEATIDQATSMEIFSELNTQVITVAFSSIYQKNAAPLDDIVVDQTAACDGGGSITVTGTVTSTAFEDGTGTFGYDLRQKPQACSISTTKGVFRVDGDPDLRITTNIKYDNWEPVGRYEFTYAGGYRWSGAPGSGGCQVNMRYGYNYTTGQMIMKGSMCGFNVDYNTKGSA